MKTLSDEDWQNIQSALKTIQKPLNPDFCTIEGIQKQIESKEVGQTILYVEQNAPFELGEDGKPKPQFDENGQSIPLFYVNECIIIEK